jgi:hypothetical protein
MTAVPQIPQSLSPALRNNSPELISATELNQWADRSDSKTTFPELLRRLLAQTPGITGIDMRAHEGTAAPGWDGRATSTGSPYLPAGELRFELGTNKQVKSKADSDLTKRVGELGDEARQYVYVFATPRSWPNGQQWADERRKEQKFADVKVVDAHTLEGWLQATPAVHYWISEQLGRQPRGATMLSAWWGRFQKELDTTIPLQFFRARRNEEVKKILNELDTDALGRPVSIKTSCVDDALAFTYAALLERDEFVEHTVLVNDHAAWSRLVESPTPLLLIPRFDAPDIGAAMDRGHRVLTIINDATEYSADNATISLPKIGRQEAAELLRQEGVDFRRAERLVALGRRSMTAFIRSISRNPVKQKPAWLADTDTATILAPLVLVGAWEDGNTRDEEHVRTLVGMPMKDIHRLLVSLCQQADAPFMQSGGLWRLVDPVDAARLLLPMLESEVIQPWETSVRDVLLDRDPYRNMDVSEQLRAQLQGVHPGQSETLRKHTAEGLVLAALSSDELARAASGIVKRLLDEAFADDTGQVLGTLAPALPVLAEAAPDEFLTVVSADLSKSSPTARTLFRDSEKGTFGPSSLHPDLLWALENLCWSSDYYGRSAMALAALVDVDIDRDDRRGNRPIESLEKITVGWTTQSAANIDDKIKVLQAINRRYPEVGWELTLLLLQPSHSSIISSTGPRYRDWELPSGPVTYDEMAKFHAALADEIVAAATSRADRWTALIDAGNRIPAEARTKILDHLAHEVPVGSWNSEDRHTVWAALTQQIDHQQHYADATWAMTDQEIAHMREIAQALEDPSDPRRYSYLFQWEWDILIDGRRYNDDGFDESADRARRDAIKNVAEIGIDAVRSLVKDVERPDLVGAYLAITGSLDDASVVGWIDEESGALQRAAAFYARNRLDIDGFAWLKKILSTGDMSPVGKQRLLAIAPMAKEYWTQVDSLGDDAVAAYWAFASCLSVPDEEQAEAVALLVEHGHPWRALELLSHMLSRQSQCESTLVKQVLYSLLIAGLDPAAQHDGYGVARALKWLESTVPDDPDLPGLEFQFFDCTPDHKPSDALYRSLGNSPKYFVHFVKVIYRAEDRTEPTRERDEDERAYATRVWKVLWYWSRIPGLQDDGSIDAEHLAGWVTECRRLLAECGRAKVGDGEVGNVLSRCPEGRDGIWPAEEVRDLLEKLKNPEIESGLSRGRYNQRGGSVRGAYDGGVQERTLAQQYETDAKALELTWPRTAAILRNMARSYESDAHHIDREDERDADEG